MTQGSPESQDEAVRQLLAASAGPEPVPPDVAARLDATLARLVEQRDESEPGVETLDLGAPRGRRWPKLLLAAAAVVVAGYGIGTVLQNGSLSGGGSADNAGTGSAAQSAPQTERGPAAAHQPKPNPTHQLLRATGPVRLLSTELRGEVRRLLDRIGVGDHGRLPKDALSGGAVKAFEPARCVPEDIPPGSRWLPATYDGERAVLVLGPARRAAGDHSVVATEVRSCSGRLLDSATVVVG